MQLDTLVESKVRSSAVPGDPFGVQFPAVEAEPDPDQVRATNGTIGIPMKIAKIATTMRVRFQKAMTRAFSLLMLR